MTIKPIPCRCTPMSNLIKIRLIIALPLFPFLIFCTLSFILDTHVSKNGRNRRSYFNQIWHQYRPCWLFIKFVKSVLSWPCLFWFFFHLWNPWNRFIIDITFTYVYIVWFEVVFFSFTVINLPMLDGDFPLAPSYGVYYISQLFRFARICNNVSDFNSDRT